MKLQIEDKLILLCIKVKPTFDELEQINGLIPIVQDWDYLIKTIIDRGIGPLLYKKLPLLTNSEKIPKIVLTNLKQVYYKTLSRSTILIEYFRNIAQVFVSNNIPMIALKGIYLSEWLYEGIDLRQISDIDILVKEEDADKCITILSGMGYKPSSSESDLSKYVLSKLEFDIVHYRPMILDGVSIDLHIKLHRRTEKYHVIVSKLWENSFPTIVNGVLIRALNTYDLLIHLCLHLDKHFRGGHVQFTCFMDITNLLEMYSKKIDWNILTETCHLYKCEDVVYEVILMIHKFINASVPAAIINKYESLLTKQDEVLFIIYLKGVSSGKKITISKHFDYLKNNQGFIDKLRYIYDILFPSTEFMIHKYKIKRTGLVLFYYPYRYYIGMRGVVNNLRKKNP